MEYKAASRGSLKLKGEPTKKGGIKKKKRADGASLSKVIVKHQSPDPDAQPKGKLEQSSPPNTEDIGRERYQDTRTPAQRKFDEIRQLREEKLLQKSGVLTHRQRIEAMNTHLSKLSEHNDMPKIGPG